MKVLTQAETAKLFGVEVKTIRDLTRVNGIVTVPVPHSGPGIGYHPEAIKRLQELLPVELELEAQSA